ncbi:MAG: 4-hydroxy-3-methylbut-2-enyl diphosphate reductase [Chloroflexi bacterium RBG_13_53_26]|nr:MAG: 4-hydroxy-3-methylbut-2-enyl diphosphate reductase [Chloroflexi bacterium RBG_13_53_26]
MDIEKATEIGFCFGVKRALKILEDTIRDHGEVETLGPVVHNQQVVDKFSQIGVKVVTAPDQIKGNVAVIPSHGVSPNMLEELASRGLKIMDTTCPNVRKAQTAARELSEAGFWVIIFGDPTHPEVKGILGWAGHRGMATLDSKSITKLDELPSRLGILSQTTRNPAQFVDFVDNIIGSLTSQIDELRIINTLCNITKNRQTAALELAKKVSLMIVVGGRNSANTRCLAQVCSSTGTETHHIETADEIKDAWLKGQGSIGITTGTSIPHSVIDEVMLKLEEMRRRLDAD